MDTQRIGFDEKKRGPAWPRLLPLLLVVLGVVWVFNWHFGALAERMKAREDIVDETGLLTPAKIDLLREASRLMREHYGVTLKITVRPGAVAPPEPPGPHTLFIGLDTQNARAITILPPLLEKSLPPELAHILQNGYFAPYLAAGTWPEGLYSALLAILEALRDTR